MSGGWLIDDQLSDRRPVMGPTQGVGGAGGGAKPGEAKLSVAWRCGSGEARGRSDAPRAPGDNSPTERPRWLISSGSYRWSFRSAIVCPMRQGKSGKSSADRTRLVAERTPMLAFNGWEILPRKRYEAGAPTNELP